MFDDPMDDEGNLNSCCSAPVTMHHEKYGECSMEIELMVDSGICFSAKLRSTATGKDIDLVSRWAIDDEDETGTRPLIGMAVFSPTTSEWTVIDQNQGWFYVDDAGAECGICWLGSGWGIFSPVKEALLSGTPLPVLVSMVE